MTTDILVDLGEEQLIKRGLTVSATVGLYNDGTDALGDTSDVGDITTEPGNGNYARQSVTLSAADLSGDWGVDNDASFSFDFGDVAQGDAAAQDVDAAFVIVNFQADDTNDSAANDHLVATAALSQTRNTGSVDSIDFGAGDLEITVD